MQGAMDSISFDIFLSYTSRDKAAVERIAFLLQQDGFAPWLDAWNLFMAPAGATSVAGGEVA